MLRELRTEIAPIIQLIFEKSLATGKIPSDWTWANVSPIFKKGEKSDPSIYRPISLTCILCKVMGHITASNLTAYLNRHNILYDLQHGFRQKRSCETQLLQLVEDLGKQLIKGNQIDLLFCQPRVEVTSCFVYKVMGLTFHDRILHNWSIKSR